MDYPRKINLGSGKDYRAGWLNIDIDPMWRPDIVTDISTGWGGIPIGDPDNPARLSLTDLLGKIEIIVANDVLEHISNLTAAMRNILDLLKEGGTLQAYVPYWLSLGADCDPTHVRKFNERSFVYYGEWANYLGWEDAYLATKSMQFKLSPLGKTMHDSGTPHDVILRTPTACDGIQVTLQKVVGPPPVRFLPQ